jgi:4-hydroxybenzoate polyprenyltransferase
VVNSKIIGIEEINLKVAIFIFLATLLAYNYQRLHRIKKGIVVKSKRLQWIKKHKNALIVINAIAALGMILIGISFDIKMKWLLFLIGVVSLWYVQGLGVIPPLRNVPYIKIFIIGFTWSITTVGLPILMLPKFPEFAPTLFGLVFCFVVIQTMPFDMRDSELDRALGVKTWAQHMSFKKSKLTAVSFCLVFFVLIYVVTQLNLIHEQLILYGHAALLGIPLLIGLGKQRGEMYYSLVIESILYFPFMFYLIQ